MVVHVGLGSRVLALLDPVSLDRLVGNLLSSAKLLCKGSRRLATRITMQEKVTRLGNAGELTGHMAIDELELIKPPSAPGLEFGQL